MRALAIACVLGGGIAACVISSFSEGQFACTPGKADTCPPGLLCARDNLCRSSEIDADVVIDAGPTPDAEPAEAGIDCPDARFNVTLDGRRPFAVAATDDGRVFVGGSQNGLGWIAEMHPCDGRILKERTISGAIEFDALTLSGEEIVAAGEATVSSGKGTGVGRFGRDLGTISFKPIDGYGGASDYVTVGNDGAIWVAGTKTTTGFAARTDTCSANVPTSPGGILTVGSNALVLLRGTSVATLERIFMSCVREDAGVGTIKAGTSDVRPHAFIATATGFAAIGTATTATPAGNTLAWIATSNATGSTWEKAELDPNPFDPDDGRALAYDGDALFAAVSQRAISGGVGTPTIYRFASPITKDAKPVWSAAPFGPPQTDIRAIATAKGRDGIFTVATNATSGAFARCTKKGECK